MSIQHLYSLDPLYGLFEKARKLAGVYWVEDIKSNTSDNIEGLYVVNTLGDPFTGFDIDTISGGPVRDFNNVVVAGHFEYNSDDNTNKIVFIPATPLLQIKFTYTKYTGKKATSNEIKGNDNQITVAPDANDSSSKIISLVDDVHLKGITILDEFDTAIYSLPKNVGESNALLGIDNDGLLNWTYSIQAAQTFATSDDINVESEQIGDGVTYKFKLKNPPPTNYTLPTLSGAAGQVLISKGPNKPAE